MHAPECPPGDHLEAVVDSPEDASKVFGLLSDHRRRLLLYSLRERAEETVELDVVLSAWVERRPGQIDMSVATVEAWHVHLPKFEECGVVDVDTTGGTIRYLGHPILDRCLDAVRGIDVDG